MKLTSVAAFEDAFLDGDLPEERLRVWRKRLHDPPDHQSLSRIPCHVGSLPPSSIPADVNGRHTVSMGTGMPSVDAATKSEGWEPRWARFLYARVARVYNWIRPFWSSRVAETRLDFLFADRIGDEGSFDFTVRESDEALSEPTV